MTFNKKEILKHITLKVEEQLEHTTREALNLKEAATNEESKAENKYDTRGLEASYMAQAQALRVSELKKYHFKLTKLELPESPKKAVQGSIVELMTQDSEEQVFYFLLPVGGHSHLTNSGVLLKTVSVSSPLGLKLIGKEVGDEFVFRKKVFEISHLS